MTDIHSLLPFIIPPLLGALIGYITNHIAIRMLFRPLRPWFLFGLRLPLTPGIIPAKRQELASQMGEMVGSHLLTADDVGRALARPEFQRELQTTVNQKLGAFLDQDLGSLESLFPRNYHGRFRELVNLLRWKIVCLVMDYLASAEFEQSLRSYLRRSTDNFLSRDLESFLTPERYAAVCQHLDERFTVLLASPETATTLSRFIDDRFESLLQAQKPLRDCLPEDLIEVLLCQVDRELPPILERFGGLLYDPEFRQRLVIKAQEAIENFLDSLGGLAGLLTGFINLENLYAKIPGFLDQTGEELARWLREEKTQQQIALMVRERLETLLDRPLGAYLEKLPYEKITGMRRYVRNRIIEMIKSRRSVDLLLNAAEKGMQRIKDRSFKSLCEQGLSAHGLQQGRTHLENYLLTLLRSAEFREALERVLDRHFDQWFYQKPVGRLSARLPADFRTEIEEGLCRHVEEMLQREIPPLIDTLDIKRMVEAKVNQLDILQVENLLMAVMKEQFKYINLFGALLGFLIGLINLLVWQLN